MAAAVLVASGVVFLLAASRPGSEAHAAGTPRLRRLVVVGDSLLAGFGNGGLVARGAVGQGNSAPAMLARRAGVSLPQPLVSAPGFPPPLRIVDANHNGQLDPGEVRRRLDGIGFRSDPHRVVRNLAVPGESVRSAFEQVDARRVAEEIFGGYPNGRDVMKFAILGLPLRSTGVSQVRRARALRPSFLLVWLGTNDVLDMATRTDPAALDLPASEFGAHYRRFLYALADTGAGMAVVNLPDVTGIAALRPAAGEVTSCRRADGTVQAVAADDLLSINLDRSRLPVPPCDRVLDARERATIRATVAQFNVEIAAAAAEVEHDRGVPIALVDMFMLFDQVRATGYDVRGDGSLVLTTRYLGGIFSLDGVHPARTANALLANTFIDAINARFGETISRVDVARVAARDPLAGSPFQPAGEPPFGLIAKETDVLRDSFDWIERHADDLYDLVDRLRDRLDDLI